MPKSKHPFNKYVNGAKSFATGVGSYAMRRLYGIAPYPAPVTKQSGTVRQQQKAVTKRRGGRTRTRTSSHSVHQPMPKTDDEVLGCNYSVVLGRGKLYNRKILAKQIFHLNGTGKVSSTAGRQGTGVYDNMAHVSTLTTIEGQLTSANPSQGMVADRAWFLRSCYHKALLTNFSNAPCEVVIRFCVAKQNIDSTDGVQDPYQAWAVGETSTINSGAADPQRVNKFSHGPQGAAFNKFWKVLKTCHFSLGPGNTKRVGLMIWYNKLMNYSMTHGVDANGAVRGVTVSAMLTVNGVPATSASNTITLAPVTIACAFSNHYSFYGLEQRQKQVIYTESIPVTAAVAVANVDIGASAAPVVMT